VQSDRLEAVLKAQDAALAGKKKKGKA